MINFQLRNILCVVLFTVSSAVAAQPFLNASIGVADPAGDELSSTSMLRLAAGYRFTDFLAVELASSEFSELEYEDDNAVEYSGEELVVIGYSRFTDADNVYFRAGIHNWRAKVNGTVDVVDNDSRDADIVFGAGYARDISEDGALKFELSRYRAGDLDINVLLVGLEARF